MNLDVRSFEVFDDGTGPALYAGGGFTMAGTTQANFIARWNGTAWSALGAGTDNTVLALEVFDAGAGPALFAGGSFANAGGGQALSIARWSGTAWSAVGGGTSGQVAALLSYDEGGAQSLIAGGAFTSAGSTSASHIAKWNGTTWSALGSGMNGDVFALAAIDDSPCQGPSLIAGGSFTSALDAHDSFIAHWNCDAAACPHAFCFGDGSGTACPCGNNGAPGNGCASSVNANGAHLGATGAASLAADTIVLHGSGMPNSSCLYFQGTTQVNGGLGSVFGDGLRCAGGTINRLGTKVNVAGASHYPAAGDASVSVRGAVTSPGLRTYQTWYRNAAPFCTPSTFNVTNGISMTWSP
jgi:hypothetical protein